MNGTKPGPPTFGGIQGPFKAETLENRHADRSWYGQISGAGRLGHLARNDQTAQSGGDAVNAALGRLAENRRR